MTVKKQQAYRMTTEEDRMPKLEEQQDEVFRIINEEYYRHREIKWAAEEKINKLLPGFDAYEEAVEDIIKAKAAMRALMELCKKLEIFFYFDEQDNR